MRETVTIKFFGAAADLAGIREVELSVKDGATLEDLWTVVAHRHPDLAPMQDALAYAINNEYARWIDTVKPGDEVAVLPPVSGG
jgi:molybdopterin converting factor subunit 1